jgi:hypothetical protein
MLGAPNSELPEDQSSGNRAFQPLSKLAFQQEQRAEKLRSEGEADLFMHDELSGFSKAKPKCRPAEC